MKASLSYTLPLSPFILSLGVHETIHFKQGGSRTKQFLKEIKTLLYLVLIFSYLVNCTVFNNERLASSCTADAELLNLSLNVLKCN